MKKEYILTVTRNDDGNIHMESTNDGFTGFEVLGFLSLKQEDIMSQLRGQVRPDKITRKVITD
jgi:arginine decarboxylase-like protein